MLENGEYQDFIAFSLVGSLARNDPDGDSPVVPGFTNYKPHCSLGQDRFLETHQFTTWLGFWENDFPIGLQYMTLEQWFDFLESAALYEPARFIYDYCIMITEVEDSPYDDHFLKLRFQC